VPAVWVSSVVSMLEVSLDQAEQPMAGPGGCA
jgi:hypothetical protein